jgi:predicted esterase
VACGVTVGLIVSCAVGSYAAVWQVAADVETISKQGATNTVQVKLWVPPNADRIRALILGGPVKEDPAVRAACAELGVAISSSPLGTFTSAETASNTMRKALATLAEASGFAELKGVPLITSGHSAGGIYARDVAYWNPGRVVCVVFHKSGNIRPPDWAPGADFRGVPFLAVSGQFEEFGPNGDVPRGESNESQWLAMRDTLTTLRKQHGDYLVSLAVEPSAGHFSWEPHHGPLAALFIRKACERRLTDEPAALRTMDPATGWLSDPNVTHPIHAAAPYAEYTGDKTTAYWHFDGEMAKAYTEFCRNRFGTRDQRVTFLRNGEPVRIRETGDSPRIDLPVEWIDDGLTFRAKGTFLDRYPTRHLNGGKALGSAGGDVLFKRISGPIEQTGADTFRVVGPGLRKGFSVMVYHPGNAEYRYCEQPGQIKWHVPAKGKKQVIAFPEIPDMKADGGSVELKAASDAGLPVSYEVEFGPAAVEGNRLRIAEYPKRATEGLRVRVTAYQLGRPLPAEEAVAPAADVTREFLVRP